MQDISHDKNNSDKRAKEAQNKIADQNSPNLQHYLAFLKSVFCNWFRQVTGSGNHFLFCIQNIELVWTSWILVPSAALPLRLESYGCTNSWCILIYSITLSFNTSVFLFLFFHLASSSFDARPLHHCALTLCLTEEMSFIRTGESHIITIRRVITLSFQEVIVNSYLI